MRGAGRVRGDARGAGHGPGSGLSGAGTTLGSHGSSRRPVLFVAVAPREGRLARSPTAGRARPRSAGRRDPARLTGPGLLAPSGSFWPPPRRRRPATRSPGRCARVRSGAGRGDSGGVRPRLGRRALFPLPLPPSLLEGTRGGRGSPAPAANQSGRWARPGRPPLPTGRRGRGGGASGRVAARKGLARGGRDRAGTAPRLCRRARADGATGADPERPLFPPQVPTPGRAPEPVWRRPEFEHLELKKSCSSPPLTFSRTWS